MTNGCAAPTWQTHIRRHRRSYCPIYIYRVTKSQQKNNILMMCNKYIVARNVTSDGRRERDCACRPLSKLARAVKQHVGLALQAHVCAAACAHLGATYVPVVESVPLPVLLARCSTGWRTAGVLGAGVGAHAHVRRAQARLCARMRMSALPKGDSRRAAQANKIASPSPLGPQGVIPSG